MYGSTPITVGILLVGDGVQMADVAPVDILGMLSTEYMSVLPASAAPLKALATPMTFLYITENGAGPFTLTGGAHVSIQASVENAPKLDILVVPGPPPNYQASDAVKTFITSSLASGTHVLSICTGILPVAASGALNGKVATGPLGVLPLLRQFFPAVKWEDARRWEKAAGDGAAGEVWTSGGVLNGVDLIAAFLREKFAKPAAEAMIAFAGVSERAREYSEAERIAAKGVL